LSFYYWGFWLIAEWVLMDLWISLWADVLEIFFGDGFGGEMGE